MFSSKSEELIRRIRLARIAHQRVQVFKPGLDSRYAEEELVNHSNFRVSARKVAACSEVFAQASELTDVVGIDEVHCFDAGIVEICNRLANAGKRVAITGVDQGFRGYPLEPMPKLLAASTFGVLPPLAQPRNQA